VTLPTEKFARQLQSLGFVGSERLAFLSFSGSLCPVHSQHMRALEAARIALMRRGWTVLAGFLAPSGDDFIKDKLGVRAWPLTTRTRLCQVAADESEWVSVCSWGEFRSYRLCSMLREHLMRECVALKGRILTGIEVMGSDTAIRILDRTIAEWDVADPAARDSWYRDRVICCIPRPSPDLTVEMSHIQKQTARRARDHLGVELIVIDSDSIFPPLEAVSSTEIRELLAAGDLETLRARGWLHPQVLAALVNEKLQETRS
jgi:hypothetical protein